MADKIAKLLEKLPPKQLAVIRIVLERILRGDYNDLDIKMIKGQKNIFRVRIGDYRIIFQSVEKQQRIISISRRNEGAYRDF